MIRHICSFCIFYSIACFSASALATELVEALPGSADSVAAYIRAQPRLEKMLKRKSLSWGAPIFIRIFKQSNELEVWLLGSDDRFRLFKRYIICNISGGLGPKLKAGDKQGPEGFYTVGPSQMNPWSSNHLSFNLGYPNQYDLSHGRTGSALMVHGGCTSEGCYAMTNYYMDEIYTLADAALARGQSEFQVHIFPFKMSRENLDNHRNSPWLSFWKNMKRGYDLFETHRLPPRVEMDDNRYVFSHDYRPFIAQIDPR
jgi:murein L,D-transpeptidase YafK